jgi:hypothetical protein
MATDPKPRGAAERRATSHFSLLMISAMYENGGNVTQRLLDGHPELFVYPFESQVGTRLIADHLSSIVPAKYRWPVLDLSAAPEEDYESIVDEECKVRIKTPQASKFRNTAISLRDPERKALFLKILGAGPRTRARVMEAFFRATFRAWRNYKASGREHLFVGYSPMIVVDAQKILNDLPKAHVLHVVRNPWSAYAETKKRAVPLSIAQYLTAWNLCQEFALTLRKLYPRRLHLLRYEDLIRNPREALEAIGKRVGFGPSPTMTWPSWHGKRLREVHPWGTIRTPTPQANRATALELSEAEKSEVRLRTRFFLGEFGYEGGPGELADARDKQ